MTANILDGHAHAQIVIDKVASELDRLPRAPGLAVVLVGCDAASQIYVQSKVRMAERLGLRGEVGPALVGREVARVQGLRPVLVHHRQQPVLRL